MSYQINYVPSSGQLSCVIVDISFDQSEKSCPKGADFHQSRPNVSLLGTRFIFGGLCLEFTAQAGAHSSLRGGKRGKRRGEKKGEREGSWLVEEGGKAPIQLASDDVNVNKACHWWTYPSWIYAFSSGIFKIYEWLRNYYTVVGYGLKAHYYTLNYWFRICWVVPNINRLAKKYVYLLYKFYT